MKFTSMKKKLTVSTITLISVVFAVIFLMVTIINIFSTQRNLKQTENQIRSSIMSKGKMLAINNSIALKNMANDNAISDIQQVVSSTVKNSNDIIYGIYINGEMKPWTNVNDENPEGKVTLFEPLVDSMSIWAGAVAKDSVKQTKHKDKDVYEFASAIIVDDEKIGTIRYGISLESMYESLQTAKKGARQSLYGTLLLLLMIGVITMIGSGFASNHQARKITNPVSLLARSADEIGKGNYNIEIKVESDDEIGMLATTFDTMRKTVKRFTEHLQELVEEKMRQVRDIMNNIDQGLFTINLDLTVNPEYSLRANTILSVEDISKCSLEQIFRLDAEGVLFFKKWIAFAMERHTREKWKKITKLAPVQEMEIEIPTGKKYIRLNYQKILNKSGDLIKIMILAQDITDSRLIEQQMEEERIQHDNEVKTILSLVNNPPEIIVEFLKDAETRVADLESKIKEFYDATTLQRENHPSGPVFDISPPMIHELFRHYHTIKGNAGTYGFELLSTSAHQSESLLEYLKEPVYIRRTDTLVSLRKILEKMRNTIVDINKNFKMLSGDQDEVIFKVTDAKVAHLNRLCNKVEEALLLEHNEIPTLVMTLLHECRRIPYKNLVMLTKKYRELIKRTSERLEKVVQFHLSSPAEEFHPNSFSDIDEALLHLLRNAIDHGIESPLVRERLGKGPGIVEFSYKTDSKSRIIAISDNGAGINTAKVLEKAIANNMITQDVADKMSESDKLKLIFKAGLSTAEAITSISGRGVGMDIVEKVIRNLQGTIELKSELGKGTTFTIILPLLINT
jgi:signal transduction histidine kinase/HAMP domain-containing protein